MRASILFISLGFIAASSLVAWRPIAFGAEDPELYRVDGVFLGHDGELLVVRKENGELSILRGRGSSVFREFLAGERVTVWFERGIDGERTARKMVGKKTPAGAPGVIDDRAFFPALRMAPRLQPVALTNRTTLQGGITG